MFARWGNFAFRFRFTVLGVMFAVLLGLAGYGLTLTDHLSQSGFDDPGSASVMASKISDGTFGRDTNADVVAVYTAPAGETVDSEPFYSQVAAAQNEMLAANPDKIAKINISYFQAKLPALTSPDKTKAIATFAIAGENDTVLASNFRDVKGAFAIPGVDVQLAGLQPIAGALNDTLASDVHRMEILAIPVVGILLFFIFGGVVAAALPLIIGGLTVLAANGVVRFLTNFVEVNTFVAPVVSLVGLGLAIDYGLFIVSRFREELGDGHTTRQAVKRSVMTAGRTVVFSATMIVASLGGLVIFPQGFLKSVAFGAIATVALAALTSITVLPAMLAILGPRVDALGFKFMRKTKSTEEIEAGPWGRLTRWVMRNPVKVSVPIVLGLLLLTLPVGNIKFGGINETYLPTDNVTRMAQNDFDANFPSYRTEPLKIVMENAQGPQIGTVLREASKAPGLVEGFKIDQNQNGVTVLSAGLVDRNDSKPAIDFIRSIPAPDGVTVLVGGTPAIEQDSISALVEKLPLMAIVVVLVVTLLMFLTFGSLVLPLKAILMTVLGLGATLGILTWIFVDGNGAGLLDFSPGPIMAPILVLIIAIIFGLSTDYEVFLLSRMVEARSRGASTSEAVRIGTSHTGRIITAAALILIVVTGAFAFSDLVMMKYIAYGMIAALIIDATLIRMFLVPSIMKMLGDDCWWAPQWMKRIQEKLGLGEPILDDETMMPDDIPEVVAVNGVPMFAGIGNDPLTQPIPVIAAANRNNAAPVTARVRRVDERRRSVTGRPSYAPEDEDPRTSDPRTSDPRTPEPDAPERRVSAGRAQGRGAAGRRAAPEPRPIESWLAELRSPGQKSDAAVSDADSSRDEPAEVRASAVAPAERVSEAYSSNGHSGNGYGSNGHNGNGSNGNGSNGRTPVPSNGRRGSRTSERPVSMPSLSDDSAALDPWFAELRRPPARPAPEPEARPEPQPRPEPVAQVEPAAAPEPPAPTPAAPTREPSNGIGGRRRRPDAEKPVDPEEGPRGRHGGESTTAISVSELIARQRRK